MDKKVKELEVLLRIGSKIYHNISNMLSNRLEDMNKKRAGERDGKN